jgi:hypothetical protein
MASKEEKYYLNLAGEYAVCSELAKRNIQANLTLGNKKSVDIIIITDKNEAVTIEVKTTNKNRFVTGFFQKYKTQEMPHPDFWVFVTIDKTLNTRFFIVSHEELAKIQMVRNKMTNWVENKNGVDNVLVEHVVDFENSWNKLINNL